MVKHNKNFKSKKKQSLKKKALRKTKRKCGKKSKKNIGGFGLFKKRDMCEPRIARFNVTENDYKNKTYKDTTSAIHGYISSGDFKEKLHNFYYKKWEYAVKGHGEAKYYFGKPRTGSSIPTIKFAFDTSETCKENSESAKTSATGFYMTDSENRNYRKPMIIKFFKFGVNDEQRYPFSLPNTSEQEQEPKQQQQPKLEQASEEKFLKNLKKYGFKIIDNRNILECDIRLPSYIGYDRKDFKDAITTDLQKSDSNFINNEWYVFYKHHDWNNQNYSSPAQHTYFQYGNPGTKITGRKFIDLLDSEWTKRLPYNDKEDPVRELHWGTNSIEKKEERDNLLKKNRNEAENDIKEINLVVKDFRLTRKISPPVFGVETDSCRK